MAKKKKITGFDALELEVARLKKRSIDLEDVLLDRVDFFRDNYKKMALNSIIPGSAKHSNALGIAGKVARFAWESGKFKNFATGALITALEFFGVQMGIKLFNKFAQSRKKKEDGQQEF
ncbi:hypothetical protein SAMN05444266_105511 [Chitinophaga jiangningensis]|uniref:Uncharacterized protein n=1 Tax=Chitinophaga jiangningensis TaxID=1419482 RepID=A0A1M7EN51_9BACT|nr:hypothetical protein [Chitinophaga jiangningensis]SHL93098.1 hypothetical protein SAMN05444266_105511 [Chitinophaga jiangningensis]